MILLIDGNNLAARANYAEPNLTRADGIKTGVVFVSIKSIKSLIDEFQPEKTIVIFDRGWSKWRLSLYPQYKENRKSENKTPEEVADKEMYITQLKRFQEYLSYLQLNTVIIKETEADDIISYICNKYIQQKKAEEIMLVSNDSDFYQFIPFGVKLYDGIKKIFMDEQYIQNKLDIPSEKYIFFKSMTGDKTDNITAIKGFGEKAAVSVIKNKQINSLQDLKESSLTLKGKKFKDFYDNFNIIERNYKLVNLLDTSHLPDETIAEIKKQSNEIKMFNNKVLDLCKEDQIGWNEEFLRKMK